MSIQCIFILGITESMKVTVRRLREELEVTRTVRTSTAEDDVDPLVASDDRSRYEGHVIGSVGIGAEVSDSSLWGEHDATSSDCDSFASLGDEATCIADRSCTFACMSTSIVVVSTEDCAYGSDSGVDDHSIKLPVHFESSVCTCVSSC